jgi:hypothetical protein
MAMYAHYIGESEHGGIVEILVSHANLEEDPIEDYFKPSWKNMEKQGDIEMSGDSESMLGDQYEYVT